MAASFEKKRVIHEAIAGVGDVIRSLSAIERQFEEQLARAESTLNATRKIRDFMAIVLTQKREELARIEKRDRK